MALKRMLRPIRKWTPQKVRAFLELGMSMGAMAGVSQTPQTLEISVRGAGRGPVYLLYAPDLSHGVTLQHGQVSHHTGVTAEQIASHVAELADQGAYL